jgi:hypothetical protein
MAYNNERTWFRFFSLSRDQGDNLRKTYFYDDIKAMANKSSPDRFTISIPLKESLALGPLREFISDEHLGSEDYGLFVSLVTDRETAIVEVPKFVRDFFKEVGGRIDFSFTIVPLEHREHGTLQPGSSKT